ncbi:MAG: PH domain-containing protein [Nanoarchaeota archaeon]|nr:PH domain-containing protein [Nanoarchaeota archaeon]MBU4299748.1 PH domain-containing protein [Nanoarchaeota archaeon]MBU4452562.1 PH domain-containing protein [Nanoarchaeota archaeon]MCG2723527.1 PH domain-containing protein [archaeon]
MVDWHLLPGEKAIHETKISRMIFWKYYFIAVALLALSVFVNFTDFSKYNVAIPKLEVSGAMIAIAGIIAFVAERLAAREMVLLTTERVMIRKRGLNDDEMGNSDIKSSAVGMVGTVRMEALKLETITNVQVRQTMIQRILGMGDIAILSGYEEHVVKDLHHPFDIERAIYRIIEKKSESRANANARPAIERR